MFLIDSNRSSVKWKSTFHITSTLRMVKHSEQPSSILAYRATIILSLENRKIKVQRSSEDPKMDQIPKVLQIPPKKNLSKNYRKIR